MSKKLVLIDGHSILNRAFFGLPDLTNSQGVHTNAVYGFLNIMFKILEEEKPARDLAVGQARGDERRDLPLAPGQPGAARSCPPQQDLHGVAPFASGVKEFHRCSKTVVISAVSASGSRFGSDR